MEDQLHQLVRAGVDRRILQMIADQPTVEEQQETLHEVEQAVYYRWWELLIDATLNGEDVSGWVLRRGERQWVQAGHNSSGPASDESDGSRPRVKRQRVQDGHNS